jgi:outer membrane protein assembly factor BamA
LAFRVSWLAAFFLFFAASLPAETQKNFLADASASAAPGLSSFSSDSSSDDSVTSDEPPASQQPANAQPQSVIERIEFLGNRRIRSDTLKARVFSREGDPYNEETLRRDFQALWNTQFFEDVKLRVEDSPDRADAKIIIFGYSRPL